MSYIYILANKTRTVLYIGVTNDLKRRVWEHKQKMLEGFTKEYRTDRLVYYEQFDNIAKAIEREKQLKKWHRPWKEHLINKWNPQWNDLYDDICL